MPEQFVADIRRFRLLNERRIEAVVKQSAQTIARIANTPRDRGGKMPVVTGTLRGSIVGGETGGRRGEGDQDLALAIAGATPFAELSFGWTAPYAEPVEFGRIGSDTNGAAFARSAAMQWVVTVEANARRASRGL